MTDKEETMPAVAVKFYPNQSNPKRASGRGNWRVVKVFPAFPPIRPYVALSGNMILPADREYKVGSRVDPRRIMGV
jgi:hypothetical protein